jgi:PAS domain S-box-containing protein
LIKALLVDDERDLAELAKEFLESTGSMTIELAASAMEAMRIMKQKRFDIIVSDYQMTKMNGIEFLRSLRAEGDTTPFILFTGRGREDVVMNALNSGADFYLQKGGDPQAQFAELSHKIKVAVERKRAADTLRESEERYSSLFNRSLDLIYVLDLKGNFIDANKAALDLMGYSREDVLGINLLEYLIDPAQVDEAKASMLKIVSGQMHEGFSEYRVRRKDGSHVEIETKSSLVMHDGKSVSILGIARDVTRRNAAAASLQERERMYSMLQEFSGVGVGYYDLDGRLLFMNSKALQHMNGKLEDLLGRTIVELFGPEAGAVYLQRIRDAAQCPAPLEFEDAVPLHDGDHHFISIYNRVQDDAGSTIGVQVYSLDITERRRAEEDLKASELRYRSVTENAIEGIVVAQDGVIKYLNPIISQMMEMPPGEALGLPFIDFVYPEDRKLVGERYRKRIQGEEAPSHYDFRTFGRNGKATWVSLSVVSIQWEGRPATLNFLMDITERKKVENDLHHSNQRLNLLSSITRHDALNQVMVIEGSAVILQKRGLAPEQREIVEKMAHAAQAIKHQMEFARSYQEIGEKAPTWQNLGKAVVDSEALVSKGDLNVVKDVNGYEVRADPMLYKVFFNLIDNCSRHSGGAKSIFITARPEGEALMVVIEDDGKGIPEEFRPLRFEPGHGRNSGYGLALIKEILAITDIGIVENSLPGNGARFEVRVPPAQWRAAIS